MVHYVDTTKARAEDLLLTLHRHLPPDLDNLGRPCMITPDSVATVDGGVTALYVVADGGCSAYRVAELPGGHTELTEWCHGEEIDRRIVRQSKQDG